MKQTTTLFILFCLLAIKGTAATVSGTLTNGSTSAVVASQTVYLIDSGATPFYRDTALTNASGVYSFTIPTSITSGKMSVNTRACGAYWQSATATYSGSNLTLNFTVCRPITVSGTAYYTSTAFGLAAHKVYLVDTPASGGTLVYRDSTFTNSTGGYSFTMPATANQFGVSTNACGVRWTAGFYIYYGFNQTINLGVGCNPPYVYDTVRNSTTGAPVWGQKVYLIDSPATVFYLDSAVTDIFGVARFTMPFTTMSSTLRVYTMACGRQTQSFSYSGAASTTAPTLSVCVSNPVVSGTVTNISTSSVVPGKFVVFDTVGTGHKYYAITTTNSAGIYSFSIPLTTTVVNAKVSTTACGVVVTNTGTLSGSSLTLNLATCPTSAAGTVSGTVTVYATGLPVSGRKVYLFDTSLTGGGIISRDSTVTNSSGAYSFTIPNSVSSAYYKLAAASCGNVLNWQYHSYSGLSLVRNLTVCGSTALATISGVITKGGGVPLAGATVSIGFGTATATTSSTGAYTLNIPSNWLFGFSYSWLASAPCGGSIRTTNDTFTYTGANITLSDSIKCPTISGVVTKQGGGAAGSAKVYLIEHHRDTTVTPTRIILIVRDSTTTASSGAYSLSGSPYAPMYHIKAFLQPGDPAYSNFLPTYHDSSLLWSGADTLTPTTWITNASNIHVSLRGGANPGGPGFIGGDVTLGANKPSGVGDPLPQRVILLTTAANKAVAYTYTNAMGRFSFSNLPYGSYKLFGDAWGRTNPPLTVTISAAVPSINHVRFEENSTMFKGTLDALSVPGAVNAGVALYPNPAYEFIRLTGVSGPVHVTLRNVLGAVVGQASADNGNALFMPVADLAAGIYYAEIRVEDAIISRQVITKQ